jgi:hypothetical protein
MPGIATHFEILRLTIARLQAAGDPNGIAAAMIAQLPYAHLGALGPIIADFLPSDPFPLDQPFPEDYATLWRRVFHLIGRKDPPGLHPILQELRTVLNEIQPLADSENCEELRDLVDNGLEDRIATVTAQFGTAVGGIQTGALEIAGIIGEGLKPKVCNSPVVPPEQWTMREFLSWKKSGAFVNALIKKADDTGDDRLRAYAFGWVAGYAAHVVGSPFINSIVGGPSRTQWWRQRFVNNYVDAWVFGFYNNVPQPVLADDTPTPDYDVWPSLCSSNLQNRITLPGDLNPEDLMDLVARVQPLPAIVPADFSQRWFEAVQDAYGAPLPTGINAGAFNSAYLFTWLVLWFQTSGSLLGCNATPPLEPPGGCGDSPSELDPFVNGVPIDGNIPMPPDPEVDYDVDEAAIVCAIILAILGGLAIGAGNISLGGAAIGGAVALLDCDSVVDLDWQDLRCLLFWERMYLHNALIGIHRLLTVAGLDYPYCRELKIDEDYQDLFPFLDPWESGKNLTKSKVLRQFPSRCWDGSLLTFNRPPTSFEAPTAIAYLTATYPDFFVDNAAANPLSNGDVKTGTPVVNAVDGGQFRRSAITVGAQIPVQLGNAVDNAVNLLSQLGNELPSWNLDGDRGLAYLTWQFRNAVYNPADVQIEPEA